MFEIDEQVKQAMMIKAMNRREQAARMIWVNFNFEGIHAYPAAADTAKEGEYDVSFLQYPHRHTFHFKVQIEVYHSDRDIEFIQFKRWCLNQFGNGDGVIQLNNNSCEMLADSLYNQIALTFPDRRVVIDVSEDLENGCSITYNK